VESAIPTDVNLFEIINFTAIPFAMIILAATWFMARVINGFFDRLGERFADRRLLFQQVTTLSRFVIWLGGIGLAAVTALRLTDQVILALTGTIAVAIGFAFKDLAASIVAGIIILIDRPFQVGDRVTFAGCYGEITGIGLRSVRLTTLDDNIVTIPNNKFLTDVVSSGNYGALDMLIQMDFYIGIDQDTRLAKRLVEDCLASSRYVYTRKPWVVLVTQVIVDGYFAYRLRAKAYVLDVKYEKAFESDVHEVLAAEFRGHGVRPPARITRIEGSADGSPPVTTSIINSAA
jgi:small-conductance mechanosensitive channel